MILVYLGQVHTLYLGVQLVVSTLTYQRMVMITSVSILYTLQISYLFI